MKRFWKRITSFALCLVSAFVCTFFSGCALLNLQVNIDDGYDEPLEEYVDPDYKFNISCSLDETIIDLDGIGYAGDKAQVVRLKPYEYLYGEEETGVSENTRCAPVVISDYDCGKAAQVVTDRYDQDGYDSAYCKYYVLDGNNEILAGPVYPTTTTPRYDHEEVVKAVGKKGLMCDDGYHTDISEMGCSYTEINFWFANMIVPLETYNEDTGEVTPIVYEEHLDEDGNGYIVGPDNIPQNVVSYIYNNKRYYFRTVQEYYYSLQYYDNLISQYTREGIKVSLIMLLNFNPNQYTQPYFLSYPAARTSESSSFRAVNTSNEYGAGYWAALMEFVADRYGHEANAENAQYGAVESFIIENEIDYANDWHVMVDSAKHEPIDVEDYSVEYERTLRIANQSIKNVCSRDVALISLTHNWKYEAANGSYAPKDILDIIAKKTRKEGNYNWGIAAHPYGMSLSTPDFWRVDVSNGLNGALNTKAITWTNLEVLQLYLEQDIKLCDGKVRDVYITEGGVSTCASSYQFTDKAKRLQAAGLAYIYCKCAQLPCIKALIYYRLYDFESEGALFGLYAANGERKPAYYVYKYIDTQWFYDLTLDLYDEIKWSRMEDGQIHTYPESAIEMSFKNLMAICPSRFDWDANWDESLIILRTVEDTPDISQFY